MTRDLIEFLATHIDELVEVPDGLNMARGLVLDCAVTGGLVSQISDEGTGHEVVAKCQNSRGRHDGSIKEAHRFDGVPSTWAVTPLGDLAKTISDGTHKTPTYVKQGVPFLSIKDVSGGFLDFSNTRFVSADEHALLTRRVEPKRGDILFCRIGTLGIPVVVETDREFSIFVSLGLIRVDADLLLPEYVALVLRSPLMYRVYDAVKAGGSHTNKLNLSTVRQLPIPVPPFAEQRRIVKKVSEISSYFDELQANLVEREAARSELTAAAMVSLYNQREVFALKHLEELVRSTADVAKLDRAIVELAVRGYLTRSMHTAKDDLSKLLAAVSDLTLETPDPTLIADSDASGLSDLPPGWAWVPLGAVLTEIKAGWSPRAQSRPAKEDEWGVLKVSACSWGEFKQSENKALTEGQAARPELEVKPGDFLISRANTAELVGRSVVVGETRPRLMLSDKTLRLKVVEGVNSRYLSIANMAEVARAHYMREASGTSSSMKNVSQKVIRRTPIPLPPREEQDRIVGVVSELMRLSRRLRMELAA
ncbi:restriction endonuclease subunit S [Amycolatopsis japonica]|uniref:restriction endonuclease subunit S n=1 Tax=Amycolatopsis japonica TaxID=208439 RepID=UPI0034096078